MVGNSYATSFQQNQEVASDITSKNQQPQHCRFPIMNPLSQSSYRHGHHHSEQGASYPTSYGVQLPVPGVQESQPLQGSYIPLEEQEQHPISPGATYYPPLNPSPYDTRRSPSPVDNHRLPSRSQSPPPPQQQYTNRVNNSNNYGVDGYERGIVGKKMRLGLVVGGMGTPWLLARAVGGHHG